MQLLWREWLIPYSGLWIRPHHFKNICRTTYAFVWKVQQRATYICHYLWQEWLFRLHAFIFLCRTNPWVKYPRNSIFLFWKNIILIWNKNVFFKKFIFKLFFLNFSKCFFYCNGCIVFSMAQKKKWNSLQILGCIQKWVVSYVEH